MGLRDGASDRAARAASSVDGSEREHHGASGDREVSTDARLSFGEALKQHRLARHLTQEALAERAAMSRRSLQALEAGTNKPYRDTAARLAAALALEAA